ncbi:MAG: ATP-binding cassette domain-containing protein [Clostridia bacterium]|nr:ATP-binding cassette domain-containing protein [Clostridia bacterium]
MIEIRNLNKSYITQHARVEALRNINLTIQKGEIFGIIGLSGAGKSSLVRCINLLETPTSGEIVIDGKDLTQLKQAQLREVRRKIGMIFQHFNLLMNSTVFDNIAFPLRIAKTPETEVQKRVHELLEIVDLIEKKNVYPSQLSGGQKQRVGIARALANHPDIILSDEATSALDPTTTESILNLLKDINTRFGITIIVITHEMPVVKKLCHKVAILENGIIVEQGSVIDIFSDPGTSTSKKFLKDMIAELPDHILLDDDNHHEEIIRAAFIGKSAEEPIISHMLKCIDVDANILTGSIESIQGYQIGNLLIKLSGSRESILSAIRFLDQSGVRTEVLKNNVE